ncbi:unnamed protein product [Closterium sp. NIES-65]|nr:unnamed protein product [Closterium sp. NIES-65]
MSVHDIGGEEEVGGTVRLEASLRLDHTVVVTLSLTPAPVTIPAQRLHEWYVRSVQHMGVPFNLSWQGYRTYLQQLQPLQQHLRLPSIPFPFSPHLRPHPSPLQPRGYPTYLQQLQPLQQHVGLPSIPFHPLPRGPHGFIQFSAYALLIIILPVPFNLSWQGYHTYLQQLQPLQQHVGLPSIPFHPLARGPHGFIQFSAYRLSSRSFAIVGFGAHYLKDHLGAVRCLWQGGNGLELKAEPTIIYTNLREESDYDAIVMRLFPSPHLHLLLIHLNASWRSQPGMQVCELGESTGDAGGDLFLNIAGEPFLALSPHSPPSPPSMALSIPSKFSPLSIFYSIVPPNFDCLVPSLSVPPIFPDLQQTPSLTLPPPSLPFPPHSLPPPSTHAPAYVLQESSALQHAIVPPHFDHLSHISSLRMHDLPPPLPSLCLRESSALQHAIVPPHFDHLSHISSLRMHDLPPPLPSLCLRESSALQHAIVPPHFDHLSHISSLRMHDLPPPLPSLCLRESSASQHAIVPPHFDHLSHISSLRMHDLPPPLPSLCLRESSALQHAIVPPDFDGLPHVLTMCAVRMGRQVEARLVHEWVSYHWHLGATQFRLYDAGAMDESLATVLEIFLRNDSLKVIPTRQLSFYNIEYDAHVSTVPSLFHLLHPPPPDSPSSTPSHPPSSSLGAFALDCLYSTHFTSQWVTVLPPDSYLYISPPHTLLSFLAQYASKPWLTFGAHEWSTEKCREGIVWENVTTEEWMGWREESPFVVEWLAYRRRENVCEGGREDREKCIGKEGQRSHFTNPRKAGVLGYYDVRETDNGGEHIVYSEMHKNMYPNLHERSEFGRTCREVSAAEEWDGWVRDVTAADYAKQLRKSPQPTV